MAKPRPIEKEEFSALMKDLRLGPEDGPFAVAVSGGPDSMALALLAADFAPVHFLTFDHGLRAESASEAKQVKGRLETKGLSHTTLKWTGEKPKTGIQAAARTARYRALEGWCRDHKIGCLLVAHTLEDQAETFLMRLLKGSGIDGLAAMAAKNPGLTEPVVTIVRPFLGVSKARLKETLKARGQIWIEDPSNENLDFTRIKIRKLLQNSPHLDAETLAATAGRLANVKGFLDDLTEDLLANSFEIFPPGYGVLDRWAFSKAASEIALRALSKILNFISQSDYPPKRDKLERLLISLQAGNFSGATLHGCRMAPLASEKILVCREAGDVPAALGLGPGEEGLWDNRFRVSLSEGPGRVVVKALGDKVWQRLAQDHPEVSGINLPHAARAALPAFFRGEIPVLVPHLGYSEGPFKGAAEFNPKRKFFR